MRIIFFGTSEFARDPLRGLIGTDQEIRAVVTQPDRPKGRGRKLLPPPVKLVAQEAGLLVKQPEDPNSKEFIEELEELRPEAIVVVAYAHKLGPRLLKLPDHGCINIHPSLLPLFRGAAPINWAIIRGEKRTGVTIMRMNERFDAGEVLMQEGTDIGESETAGDLSVRLSSLGSALLVKTLAALERNEITPERQDENSVTKAPRITKADCEVDWSRTALEICNLVRGLHPKPGAFTYFRDKVIKLSGSVVSTHEGEAEPGRIVDLDGGVHVMTGQGVLNLQYVQPEGKREMSWTDFKNGFRPQVGEKFGDKRSQIS
jgi:methionyl-tRNA formyltransferase